MNIRFYIDPNTDLPHIYNHQVNEQEVEDILRKPGEDRQGREGSRVAIGKTQTGRYLKIIYIPDPEPNSIFSHYSLPIDWKTFNRLSTKTTEKVIMSQNQQFPLGWNEDKIQKVIDHYENQSEEEALEEDEAALADERTIVQIPISLVPLVRELLAKYQKL